MTLAGARRPASESRPYKTVAEVTQAKAYTTAITGPGPRPMIPCCQLQLHKSGCPNLTPFGPSQKMAPTKPSAAANLASSVTAGFRKPALQNRCSWLTGLVRLRPVRLRSGQEAAPTFFLHTDGRLRKAGPTKPSSVQKLCLNGPPRKAAATTTERCVKSRQFCHGRPSESRPYKNPGRSYAG